MICRKCEDTLPQILSDRLEGVRNDISTSTYAHLRQKIDQKWQTAAPDPNWGYACVARQLRFRNSANETGKWLGDMVAHIRVEENRQMLRGPAVDVRHVVCDRAPKANMLCWECSVVLRVDEEPSTVNLVAHYFDDEDLCMEVKEDVMRRLGLQR